MKPIIIACLLVLSTHTYGQEHSPKAKVKIALDELREAVNSGKPLNKNSLNAYQLDNFLSRGHLYYYRALGNSLLAKTKSKAQKMSHLQRALSDLKLAKLSPGLESQRIDELTNNTLKELIEQGMLEKKYKLVIDSIELLPQSDKVTKKYIVYYAYALFNSSKRDAFKKLAHKYGDVFRDEKVILSFLPAVPKWQSHVPLVVEQSSIVAKVPELSSNPKYTKSSLLEDPRTALDYLGKSTYFSDADLIFKLASPLYFSLYQKTDVTAKEAGFVRQFQQRMNSFAPAFIDELITAHWKQADLKEAKKLSEAFLKQYEGHALYPKVLFNLGRIQEDQKSYHEAFVSFQRFIKSSDNIAYLEYARFRSAWVLHLAKKDTDAMPYFIEYVKNYPDGRYASTCEYFLIKITGSQESENGFIKKYPLNLYSYILANESKLSNASILETFSAADSLKALEQQFKDFKADIKTIAELNLVDELLEFGLNNEAIKVLKSFPFDEKNELFAFYLAAQLHALNDTHGEVRNLVKVATHASALRAHIPWRSLFPQYRIKEIEKELAVQNSALSPFLVLSLIRQESMFEPKARSTANALGLMQVTQGTANQAALQLGIKDFSLFKEEDNLKIGIKTFSDLLKKFDNRLDYALSAYNAGVTPTSLWIKLRGDLAPLEFIESIPYQETRQYIKSILRNYAIYQLLYKERSASLVSYNL